MGRFNFRHLRDKWHRFRLGAVERYYFELKDNPTHPFEELGDGIFFISVTSDKFVFGVGLVLMSTFGIALFIYLVSFYLFAFVLYLVSVLYGFYSMYGHLTTKELIISRNGGYLMRIKRTNKILVDEPINNCYIKLQRKFDSNRKAHFYLILGGYKLDDIRISTMAADDGALVLLGRSLATRMGVNYFDCEANSNLHHIVHYPGFTSLNAVDADYYRFIDRHDIDEDEVTRATADANLPRNTTIIPEKISGRIRKNYITEAGETGENNVKAKRGNINEQEAVILTQTVKVAEYIKKWRLQKEKHHQT